MRNMLSAVLLGAVIAAVPCAAQAPTQRVNVPFAFEVGNKVLPAGDYEVHSSLEPAVVTLRSGKNEADAMVITDISKPEAPLDAVKLVFDRVGDKRILSEVYLPGEEGLLVHVQKGRHEHQILHGHH